MQLNGQFTAIDLFCGAGGVSQGLVESNRVKILAAVNHSPEAIAAHQKNNPDIIHLTEDIKNYRVILPKLPRKPNILWASAECTNYSIAKGGQSRNADSRTLPEYLPPYVRYLDPDYFIVENVKEFLSWGPLEHKIKDGKLMYDKKGGKIFYPSKLYRGTLYDEWVESICDIGYEYEKTLLNAADFGAHTNRTRYFGIFAKPGLPIIFPTPTHAKNPGMFEKKKWKACREKIDLENEGTSIFGRKYNEDLPKHRRKRLVRKTMARIAYGLRKYHLNDFIAKAYGTLNASSLDKPLDVISTKDRHAKIKVEKFHFISKAYGAKNRIPSNTTSSIDDPLHTITTIPGQSLITCEKGQFITKQQFAKHQVSSIDDPMHAIVTGGRQALITADKLFFIVKQQGQEKGKKPYNAVSSIDVPLHTIMTANRHVLVQADSRHFIAKKEGNKYNVASLDEPMYTILTKEHGGVITVKGHFITQNIHGAKTVSDIKDPIGTILTEDEKVLITAENPQLQDVLNKYEGGFIVTIHLNTKKEKLLYKEKIRFFLRYFPDYDPDLLCLLIPDIKMRYLISYELAGCSGFKDGTYLGRTETERKYHIGNAVPPVIPKNIAGTLYDEVKKLQA